MGLFDRIKGFIHGSPISSTELSALADFEVACGTLEEVFDAIAPLTARVKQRALEPDEFDPCAAEYFTVHAQLFDLLQKAFQQLTGAFSMIPNSSAHREGALKVFEKSAKLAIYTAVAYAEAALAYMHTASASGAEQTDLNVGDAGTDASVFILAVETACDCARADSSGWR